MAFLSPMLIAAGIALGVPLWLHLRRRRRQNPVEFPSLRYLKVAAARVKRQAKVEDVSLLLLRLLLVALLVAAFARPVTRHGGGWLGAGRSVESVIVIDATASMGLRTGDVSRFDAAKRLAREWIDGLNQSDSVALWILTDRLEQPVPVPIADRDHLFRQLDGLEVSEGSATLATVFNAAREWAAQGSASRREMVVITDNQRATWDWPAIDFFKNSWNRRGIGLVVLAPDATRVANAAVVAVEWDAREVRPGGLLNGVAKLENFGDEPVADLLECRIAGQAVFRKPVEIPAKGTLDVPLSLTAPVAEVAVFTGEIALAGDALACDDRWHFALPVRRLARSLVVDREGGAGGGMRPSFFLAKALAAGGAGNAEVIDAGAWPGHATDGFDSIWFTTGAVRGGGDWEKAISFADAGGVVVLTGDCQPDPLPQAWPVGMGQEINLAAGRIATRLIAPSHPLFEGVWNERLPFPPLSQRIARNAQPSADSRVLATLAGELPFIVEKPRGNGSILWWNASADRSWGDLPLSPAYVALVQQMAGLRQLLRQSGTSAWVGAAWPDLTKIHADAAWPVDGNAVNHLRTHRSGVFEASAADGKPVWSCAVNVRREESNPDVMATAELEAMLPGRVMAGRVGIREWREEIRREVPLWPWLLGIAALVYLAEGWVSTVAAKRREPAVAPTASVAGGRRVIS